MVVSRSQVVLSRSPAETEGLRKYPLPPPLNIGGVKVPALNWTCNKPDGNTPHVGFDELFRSEEDENDTGQQDFGAGQDTTLDISEEDQKFTHELLLESMETKEIDIKLIEDCERDTKSNIRITGDFSTTERPQKRRRTIMDAVEVPSVSWVISKRRDIKREHVKREKEHKNPVWKVEVKKDCEFGFSLDTVFRRIDDLNIKEYPLHLDEEFLNATVSREFLSGTFGGNSQQTFPKISEKNYQKHGYDDFMYLNLDYNPRAPQRAGFPGLFFQCSDADLKATWGEGHSEQQRVFIRIATSMWLYVGQYEFIRAACLTVEEWKTQSYNVMTTWSEKVCTQSWAARVRTRISLRKTLHREPTTEEVDRGLSKNFQTTSEEVIQAYNSGRERIAVWVMKCVSYDEGFQRNIVEKYQHWAPKEKPAKAPKRKR